MMRTRPDMHGFLYENMFFRVQRIDGLCKTSCLILDHALQYM